MTINEVALFASLLIFFGGLIFKATLFRQVGKKS
jgi:hypothetical protein